MTTRTRVMAVLFAILFCFAPAFAQMTVQGGAEEPSPAKQEDHPSSITVEFQMTQADIDRLLASVDEMIAFDSKFTGLQTRGTVERKMTNRDEIKQLMTKRIQDPENAERVQRSTAVLQKFGFVPRDFDTTKFAVESMTSQLAGYYDPKVKTLYLLNWLPAQSQRPVMAHELDHALQDQNFDLSNWLRTDDPAANAATGGDNSEQHAARRAVIEGQATAVMIEYMLSSQGRSLTQLPPLAPEVFQSAIDRYSNLQTTQSAPLIMRQEMTFPYVYGLAFIHQVMLKSGKQEAFTGIFKRPPISTREIMEPAVYLAHEKLPALPIPDVLEALGKDYEKVENGSLGEFDCTTLIKQYGKTPEEAKAIATNWRGDYFFAATWRSGNKSGAEASKLKPEDVSLLFTSRWASPAAALAFAKFYRSTVPKRYADAKPAGTFAENGSAELWNTAEGPVSVRVAGDLVVVVESFDQSAGERLISAVLSKDK